MLRASLAWVSVRVAMNLCPVPVNIMKRVVGMTVNPVFRSGDFRVVENPVAEIVVHESPRTTSKPNTYRLIGRHEMGRDDIRSPVFQAVVDVFLPKLLKFLYAFMSSKSPRRTRDLTEVSDRLSDSFVLERIT